MNIPMIDTAPIKWLERWSIFPAYTINGYLPGALVWQGLITTKIFNAWIKSTVLPHCIPGYTILVLNNASIYKSQEFINLCTAAQIYIKYLPPYCPEFNPIEHSFHDLKAWIWLNFDAIKDY